MLAQTAAPRSTNDGVYSAAQAARGEDLYAASCGACHGADLISTDQESPSLTGARFTSSWTGKTLAERFKLIRTTMPSESPGTLDDQTSIDVLAYILKFNGYPAGEQALGFDSATLEQIVVEPVKK